MLKFWLNFSDRKQNILFVKRQNAVSISAVASVSDTAGVKKVNSAFAIVFLMHNVGVSEKRNIAVFLLGGTKQRTSAALDKPRVTVTDENSMSLDLKHKLGFAHTVKKGVAVTHNGDKRGIGHLIAKRVKMAATVTEIYYSLNMFMSCGDPDGMPHPTVNIR